MGGRAREASHRDVMTVLGGVLLSILLGALDQTIVAAALPAIGREFGNFSDLSWLVSVYLLTATVTTPIYGKLSDRYGRRALMLVSIGGFVLASIACAMASSLPELVIGRALQGIGGGGLFSLAHAAIADVVSPRERGRYQGYISGTFAAASIAGPALGGVFSEHVGWRWIFWINLPLGVVAFLAAHRALRRLPVPGLRPPIDWIGALLLVAGISALLYVLSAGGHDHPWTSAPIIGSGALGIVTLALLWGWEKRAANPLLPPRFFAIPVYRAAVAVAALMYGASVGAVVMLPLFYQTVFAIGPSAAGALLIAVSLGTVLGALWSGRRIAATGRYRVFPLAGAAMGAGLLGIFALFGRGLGLYGGLPLLLPLGIAYGFAMPVALVAVQNAVPRADLGIGTASVSFFRALGGAFGAAAVGAIVTGGSSASDALAWTRFADGFWAAACFAACAFLVACVMPEPPLRTALNDAMAEPAE